MSEDRWQEGYDEGYGEGYYTNQDDCDAKLTHYEAVVDAARNYVNQHEKVRTWPHPRDAEDTLAKEMAKAYKLTLELEKALAALEAQDD